MNVLVIGRGGREHSLVKKFKEDKTIRNLYVAPGNDGMVEAVQVPIEETDMDQLVKFAKLKNIDLTIVGPENPLLEGISNRFQEEGLTIFAPTKEAALIEGSKSFAKQFMKRHQIPTAAYETFTDVEQAIDYVQEKGAPIVVKADGLAAGKGVVVAHTEEEAIQALEEMLVANTFANAGQKVVLEEFLDGEEFSLMAFVHGKNVYPMTTARDHKRAYDHDEGPNTGGMGAYAPVGELSKEVVTFATENILQKAADGLVEEGRAFTGILYAGLILTDEGPKVIEFNARFGDPETQVVLPLMKNSLLQVLTDILAEKNPCLEWEDQVCLGVVLAAKGYPATYEKEIPLPVISKVQDCFTVYAGVKNTERGLVSNGGRVLLVGAKKATQDEAVKLVYQQLKNTEESTQFFYRKDIGIVRTFV